jgi:ribosomal protein S14
MKKLYTKDKFLRKNIKTINKKYFILKLITLNSNLFLLLRYNAYLLLKAVLKKNFIVSTSNRCVISYNKKRFNKYTLLSRSIFLKKIQHGEIVGYEKSS